MSSLQYFRMWEYIQKQIVEISADKYFEELPEINFIAAIVVSAGRDHDKDYLTSDDFLYHCSLLRLKSDYIKAIIEKAWEIEKNDRGWNSESVVWVN